MKKFLALLMAAIMLLSVMSFASAEEQKVLTIVAWDANTTEYLADQKAAYEAAHPDVTIEYIDVASQDYEDKVFTMLSGGDTSDIFMVKTVTGMQDWIEAGFAEPLTPYMEACNYDCSGFVGGEVHYAADGVQYALPFRSDFWVMFYNKDLFDAAGIAYPTNDMTWDEYYELAVKLTDAEKGIYGTHIHTWLSAAVNWAVCDGVNTLVDGEYSDLIPYFELVQKLEDAGACMAYDELKASGLHYSAAFANGNIAMMNMGYWYVSTLIGYNKAGTATFNWGICAVPHAEGVSAGSSFGSLTGAMINTKSTQKDLAWDYIAWLCGEEGSKATATRGNRPAWVSEGVAAVMAAVDGFPADETSAGALLPSYVAIEIPAHEKANEISGVLNEEYSMIMTRECTIEEGVAEMNERVAELFE